jgi:hypothetical protein
MFIYILIPLLVIAILGIYFYKSLGIRTHKSNLTNSEFEILEISIPKNEEESVENNTSALSAEHMFASLHGLLTEDIGSQEHFSFEITANELGIKFYLTAPIGILKFVESQIYAQYPKAQLKIVEDYVNIEDIAKSNFEVGHFRFLKDYFFPIKMFRDFEIDPLANVLSTLSEVKGGEGIWLQFLISPLADGWQEPGHDYIAFVTEGKKLNEENLFVTVGKQIFTEAVDVITNIPATLFKNPEPLQKAPVKPPLINALPKLTTFQELSVKGVENKISKMGFGVVIRALAYSDNSARTESQVRSVAASVKQFTGTTLNDLDFVKCVDKEKGLEDYKDRFFDTDKILVLNNEELATMYHLPSNRNTSPNVSWVYSKMGEPPSNLPTTDCTYIGDTLYRGKKVRFGLTEGDDRLRHMYLIGKTGTGKSTLLETMITQDIKKGHGVGVLDPHGETIDKILERIPDERVDDVVVFDPSDTDRPVGLNLLEMQDPSQKNLMASALIAAIKQQFDYSWGPRLEYLLNYSLLTLLEVPGTSMLGITRLLEDDNYRNYILHKVKDPVVLRFWEKEFRDMKGNQKLVTEAIAPIQNKINRFLASTTIRNILGQRKSTIDIWDVMQSNKILLINLSKGKIGADNANLLGALLVSRIQFMALQRAKIPYEQRKPFYLYVDEFQNFATGSFEEILSESRKYKLGLYLTHQYTSQLPEALLKAVFGNVGTIATFSLGAPDARVLSSEFAPYFDDEDIISLERFHVYIKLMIDGMTSLPFSAKIILPWMEEGSFISKTGNKDRVLNLSRDKYGVDREYIEDLVSRWVTRKFDKGMAIAEEHKDMAQQNS